MRTEQEINEKLIKLKTELDAINELEGDHLQEYSDKWDQIKLIEWVLNKPVINKIPINEKDVHNIAKEIFEDFKKVRVK